MISLSPTASHVSMMLAMGQMAVGTDSLRLTDVHRRLKAIFIDSIGNLVEWYDFYAYTAFALYFADSFFPGNDPVVQQLNAAVLFVIGFIMRPIGGWLFGHLADHHGRRNALMMSVLLLGGPLCAIVILLLLQQLFLTAEQMRAWGWQIPFVIGALLAIVALMMRRNLHETTAFIEAKTPARRESSSLALLKYPREVLTVVGLTAGGTTAFYTYTSYMQKFLKLSQNGPLGL
jgi:MFS family permease